MEPSLESKIEGANRQTWKPAKCSERLAGFGFWACY